MEILNETVYDSGDLERVILHAQQKSFEQAVQHAKQHHAVVPHRPVALPEQIRFGYYNNPVSDEKPRKGRQRTSTIDVCYVSSRGRGYRHNSVARIGLAPPTKLPLSAMEIVARAASDDDGQRTLPPIVLADLVVVLMRTLFNSWIDRSSSEEFVLDECPPVHYGFKTDRESAKQSKSMASEEALRRIKKKIEWAEERIVKLGETLVEEQEKLTKLRARLAKLEGKKEMSYVQSE